MWNDFVSAIFTTFCESAAVVHRDSTGVVISPVLLRSVAAGINSSVWGGFLIDVLRSRPRLAAPLPPFDLASLSQDSLWRIVLMPVYSRDVNNAALDRLQNPIGMPTPATHTVGVRDRTDDLLGFFAAQWDGTFPLSDALDYVRDEILYRHREWLSLFIEGFTRVPPTSADNEAELFIDYALQQLTVDDSCDDVFRSRCAEPIAPSPMVRSNRPPRSAVQPYANRSVLDRVLAEKFDSLDPFLLVPSATGTPRPPNAPRVPTPNWSRFALYLSYFGRFNAILIADILTRIFGVVIPQQLVVQTLALLYYGILVTL